MSGPHFKDSEKRAQQPEKPVRLSDHLRKLDKATDMTVGSLVDILGGQAFGAMMFVFAAPNLIPNPPGTSLILGLPLLFLTIQLVLGRKTIWLPASVREREIPRQFASFFLNRVPPVLARFEGVLKPRYKFLAGTDLATRLIGLVAMPLALILLLPLPFVHMLPGAAMTCFAIALAERDGLAAACGHVLTAASLILMAILALSAHAGVGLITRSLTGG